MSTLRLSKQSEDDDRSSVKEGSSTETGLGWSVSLQHEDSSPDTGVCKGTEFFPEDPTDNSWNISTCQVRLTYLMGF